MSMSAKRIRSGTFGSVWLDGELGAEAYGCKVVLKKSKEKVHLCDAIMAGHKMTDLEGTGELMLYNATSRLVEAEASALKDGRDVEHTVISKLADPDNPNQQRFALSGVSFDDLTLADWEAAKLGTIRAPFTFDGFDVLDT